MTNTELLELCVKMPYNKVPVFKKSLLEAIKKRIKEKGFTLYRYADHIGLDKALLRNTLYDTRRIVTPRVLWIASDLGLNVNEYLLKGSRDTVEKAELVGWKF